MKMNPKATKWMRLISSIFLILLGALLFFQKDRPFLIRAFGIALMVLASIVARIRAVKVPAQNISQTAVYSKQIVNFKRSWLAGFLIFGSLALSFYLLHLDAISGGNQIFPVFYFSFSGLAAMGYLVYLSTTK